MDPLPICFSFCNEYVWDKMRLLLFLIYHDINWDNCDWIFYGEYCNIDLFVLALYMKQKEVHLNWREMGLYFIFL